MRNIGKKKRLIAATLLSMGIVASGTGMAADGRIGASQFYSRVASDVNGKSYRIAEIPDSWYRTRPACTTAVLNSTPYVASFVGGDGHFGNSNIALVDPNPYDGVDPTNKVRTDYYAGKMMAMANALTANGNCVKVVSIEIVPASEGGYGSYVAYGNYNFFGASMTGSYEIYWPMSRGASAEFAITLAMQKTAAYSSARWYLHGGSGSAMHAARLLDMLNDGAVAAYAYKIPEATILESLPISGDMLEICRNVKLLNRNDNTQSDANAIISTIYANGDKYANSCEWVKNNPDYFNYKVLGVRIRDWYVGAKGKSVYVMMGANDPLWKETLDKTDPNYWYVSSSTTNWTSLGLYRNFLATIGVAESGCTNRSAYVFDASHASYMWNSDQKADCGAGGRIKIRQYQHGGHGPLSNYMYGAHPDGNALSNLRSWLW